MNSLLEIVRTFRTAQELWATDPSQLIERSTGNEFDHSALPILICAKDEAASLPATLTSLALSELPVMPIVVDNASEDETATIAEKMGAKVVSEPTPGKLAAFLTGLEFIVEESNHQGRLLMTDADTIVNRNWAGSLTSAMQTLPVDEGGITFGLVGISGGPSPITDILRTLAINKRQLTNKALGKTPGARGPHTGIVLGSEKTALQALRSLPRDTYYGIDTAQRNSVVNAGGSANANISPHIVVARGDRYQSVQQYIAFRRGKISQAEVYQENWAQPA